MESIESLEKRKEEIQNDISGWEKMANRAKQSLTGEERNNVINFTRRRIGLYTQRMKENQNTIKYIDEKISQIKKDELILSLQKENETQQKRIAELEAKISNYNEMLQGNGKYMLYVKCIDGQKHVLTADKVPN